jgi:hypothetical protein
MVPVTPALRLYHNDGETETRRSKKNAGRDSTAAQEEQAGR